MQLKTKETLKYIKKNAKRFLEDAGISAAGRVTVKEIKKQDFSLVFRIDANKHAYALKIFVLSKKKRGFFTNILFNQIVIDKKISSPKIIFSSNNSGFFPFPWILWEWLPGKQASKLKSEADRYAAAIKTGGIMRAMHQVRLSSFGSPDSNCQLSGQSAQATINYYMNRINVLINNGSDAFSEMELGDIYKVTADSKELLMYDDPRLLHGDLTGSNVIVSDTKEISIIDPGIIIAGDPMSDLGYSQTTLLSKTFRKGIWERYTGQGSLSGDEYNRFKRWRLLRQVVIACRAKLNNNKAAGNYIKDALLFYEEVHDENIF